MSGLRARAPSEGSLRCSPWRGTSSTALVVPVGGRPVTSSAVLGCVDRLGAGGYTTVLTAALGPADQHAFLAAGFAVREHLALLAHDLSDIDHRQRGSPYHRLRRVRRPDREAILAVDRAAFAPFWQLGETGLDEALGATPTARFRAADAPGLRAADGGPAGYAITGRSGGRCYLQRLAVHPVRQREGIGSALALDALRWARRRGAREVLVNTQAGNTGAIRLYQRLGFRQRPDGLAVLARQLGEAG